jgi:hypothetical protein
MIESMELIDYVERLMAGAGNIKEWLKRSVRMLLQLQLSSLRKVGQRLLGFGRWPEPGFAPRFGQRLGRAFWSIALGLLLVGCVSRAQPVQLLELPDVPNNDEIRRLNSSISKVAPPAVFLDLDELLMGSYLEAVPEVAIASPQPNQIIEATDLTAKIKLRGLSIYKDEKLGLGPHLQVSLDNQPARSIYSLEENIDFSGLSPGSHTLRVLAVKPWGESFKNEAAYAQTTFHIFANTGENTPDPEQPQLIYSEPQGTYGAQPILLDFYLNNALLHLIAKEDSTLTDWKIRCEVNGQSFVFDQWQPIYLTGFNPGQNWVQLTLIDTQGNPIDNAFNSTIRLVNYDPDQRDTLAKMTRGELQLKDVGQIVNPNYEPPAEVIAPVEPPTEPLAEEKAVEEKAVKEKAAQEKAAEEKAVPEDRLELDAPASAEPEAVPEKSVRVEPNPAPNPESESKFRSEPAPQKTEIDTVENEEALKAEDLSEREQKSILEEQSSSPSSSPNESEKSEESEEPIPPETILEDEPAAIPLAPPQTDSDSVSKPGIVNRIQTLWKKIQTPNSDQSSPTDPTDTLTNNELTENELLEKSDTDESVINEPITDEPVTNEPVTNESVTNKSVIDKPAMTDESAANESVTNELVMNEPVIDEPVLDEPVTTDELATDESVKDALKSITVPQTLTSPELPGEVIMTQPQ